MNMSSSVICRCVFTLCFLLTLVNSNSSEETKIINAVEFDPDTYLPTNKIIERHGYPCESHEVTTGDGYILTMHRIPHGKKSFGRKRSSTTLPPVYFQHGILGSSADWIINGPERSLAYQLADKGHDVWLGNIRGNTYSRGHVSLSPDNAAFWNFTFHEMGTHDLTTMIDFILETTGHDKLYYIGHSMGTTVFYVLCSMKPEYNDKIITMFALAPVAFLSNAESPIRYFAPYSKDIQLLSKWFGEGEFLPRNAFINFVLKYGCEISSLEIKLCENNLFIICGHDPVQFNKSLIPVIFGHTPAGTSTKTLAHFAQEIQSGYFRQFDYGSEHNPKIYDGNVDPPSYDLSKVTAPISLHFADNDLLANPKDVKKLAESLPNVIALMRVDFHLFNHLDFLWSKDVNHLLNDKIISMIDTIETDDVIPRIPYSLEDMSEKLADNEPVFNDISSLLKHKMKKASQGYLDGVLNIRMSAEKKLKNLKMKTKNTIKRKLKSLTNIFQNMLGTNGGEPVDDGNNENADLSVENQDFKNDGLEMEVINQNSLAD